jgi:hypothetical protein
MRLDELTGVKKYRERDLHDVISDFVKAGGEWLGSGRYANVIGFPGRDYVWKFFPNDSCYIGFVRWALRNPAPYLPVFLNKPRWIVPFYRRQKTEAKLCVVKLERLEPNNIPKDFFEQFSIHGGIAGFLEASIYARRGAETRFTQRIKDVYAADPRMVDLAEGYWALLNSPVQCSLDLHTANIMQRRDGTLVFTDPYWIGENPYQAYAREMANQNMDDFYPEEEPGHYVSGGELPKRPRKKKPKPYIVPSYDDLPF